MPKVIDRLNSIQNIITRKHQIQAKRELVKSKMAASRSFSVTAASPAKQRLQIIRPEWVLRRNSVHVIEDPYQAIKFVMNCLNSKHTHTR